MTQKGAKGDGSVWPLSGKLKSSEGINLHCFCLCKNKRGQTEPSPLAPFWVIDQNLDLMVLIFIGVLPPISLACRISVSIL